MAKLYLKFEKATLQEANLTTAVFTIGRMPDNSFQIDNLAVSARHAKIYWEKDHYVIEDLGSLNGTWVNGQRVGKATLRDGDQIAIGKHFVQFKDEGFKPFAGAPRPFSLLYPGNRHMPRRTRVLIDFLLARLAGPTALKG